MLVGVAAVFTQRMELGKQGFDFGSFSFLGTELIQEFCQLVECYLACLGSVHGDEDFLGVRHELVIGQ